MTDNILGIIVGGFMVFGCGYLLGYNAMKGVSDEWREMYYRKKKELSDAK